MRYRAVLNEPGKPAPERSMEIFGQDGVEVRRWASLVVLASSDEGAFVDIYETRETKIALIVKPKPEVAGGAT